MVHLADLLLPGLAGLREKGRTVLVQLYNVMMNHELMRHFPRQPIYLRGNLLLGIPGLVQPTPSGSPDLFEAQFRAGLIGARVHGSEINKNPLFLSLLIHCHLCLRVVDCNVRFR